VSTFQHSWLHAVAIVHCRVESELEDEAHSVALDETLDISWNEKSSLGCGHHPALTRLVVSGRGLRAAARCMRSNSAKAAASSPASTSWSSSHSSSKCASVKPQPPNHEDQCGFFVSSDRLD
jgi:hypothetical protein